MKSKANGLMGDLESIKALLEEDDLDSTAVWELAAEPVSESGVEPAPKSTQDSAKETTNEAAADPVPVLVDPVLADEIAPTPVTSSSAAALDAILGSDFHDATAQVMARARGLIEEHPNKWSPQQTDELSDALRVRIDDAVQEWISTALAAHAGELQQRLLDAVRDELARHLASFRSDPTQT